MNLLHPMNLAAGLLLGALVMTSGIKLVTPPERWSRMSVSRKYSLLLVVIGIAGAYALLKAPLDLQGLSVISMGLGILLWLLAGAMFGWGLMCTVVGLFSRRVAAKSRRVGG